MTEYQDQGQAFDWDTPEVEDTGNEFVLIDEGTYPFVVESLTRTRFEGNKNIAACPKAEIRILVNAGTAGLQTVTDSLLLNTKMQWKVAQFFEGLGFPKNPETNRVQINWTAIIGRQGWAKVGPRDYTAKNGETKQANDVRQYLSPSEWPQQPPLPQAAPATPAMAPAMPAAATPQPAAPIQQQMPIAAPAPQPSTWQNPQGGF